MADDDPASRRRLELLLERRGFEVRCAADGERAWQLLLDWRPDVALLDWHMPLRDGAEVCREFRRREESAVCHLILVTARDRTEDLVTGMQAGADDYVRKPVDEAELVARIRAGERMSALRRALSDRVAQLELALAEVKRLEGLLPICAYCKKIRDGHDYWHQLEAYITERTDARFSHGICPGCRDRVRAELLQARAPVAG